MGTQSKYTCPDCRGVLVEIREGRVVRFRCHTVRAMEERFLLLRQLAVLATQSGKAADAKYYQGQAKALEKRIQMLRQMVLSPDVFGHESAI